ncbi:major facilitator superfamily protein [Striga asiatica]|uniref:Major facilitator superfamily protein n=1 Tax=Striga asiatica TaxID=4170 RepID=A0A5A7R0G8_STRAF|nr:major facilitator superfamily protein [Striga asiatica]
MENLGRLSHLFAAVFMSNMAAYAVNPAITDVIVEAVCGGKQECSLAIYLTGVQLADIKYVVCVGIRRSLLRSLVSKQSGPHEQGIAQGCILGITSLGNLLSPIVYSPLSALFLAEDAPFYFPGFSIFCVGLAYLIGSILSVFIKIHIGRRSRV